MKMCLKLILLSTIIETFIVIVAAQINLATQGVATQSSSYPNYPAILAIEGPANNKWNAGCSVTANAQRYSWWALQLPAVAHMTNILIYYREGFAHRMDQFRLYLVNGTADQISDSGLCYSDKEIPGKPAIIQNITCNMLAKNMYFVNSRSNEDCFVELCYVAIYGCWKGFWGKNCTVPCPPTCIGQHCYPASGSCVWGCDHTNCMNKNCYKATGVCLGGCVFGQAGQYCNKYNLAYNETAKIMPVGQTNARLSVDGLVSTCISFSSPGTSNYLQVEFGSLGVITTLHFVFGDNTTADDGHVVYCSNTTDKWIDGILLYNGPHLDTDITIFAVCKYVTYVPPMLSGNSMVELCEMEIGGCKYGRYGENCEHVCPENCFGQGPCDLVSGNCSSGCLDGWVGAKCDQACIADTFGNECLLNCSTNCLSPPCNHVTGECDGGCNRGWERLNCTDKCSSGTFGWNCSEKCNGCTEDSCDHISGVCTNLGGCKQGYEYGQYCNKTCSAWYFGTNCTNYCNCLDSPCDTFSGQCSTGDCKRGWDGVSCDKKCTYGYFGFNCNGFCANCLNESCSVFDGNCTDGCFTGYSGDMCDIEELSKKQISPSSDPGPAIGGVVGAILIVTIVVIIAVIIYRRRLASRPNQYLSEGEHLSGTAENTYINHDPSPKPMNVFVNKGCDAYLEDVSVSLPQNHASNTSGCDGSEEIPQEYDEEYEGNVYGNVQTKADYKIAIADLKKVINEKQKDEGFKKEYDILPRGLVHAHMEGSKEENKLKNRFLATWPYDHSRIVLTGETKSDYINASFIDSYEKEKAYIASQGPKKNTIRDFWHMIWQEKVNTIVMVTKLEEERRKKCEPYWPQSINKVMLVDNYRLVMKKEIQHTVYVYRLIILQSNSLKNKQERKIHHFHFTQWPDHGVPDSVKLVNFYRKVKSIKVDRKTPMVVHCSAGVGRTGTFIAIDALYEHGQTEGYVDIMEYVQTMRKDRMNMVQTHEQYEVVFKALLELFTVPDTSIHKSVFCEYIQKQEHETLPRNKTVFREEFQRLQMLRPIDSADNYTTSKCKENVSKNSSKSVLANDNYRPYLMTYGRNRNDYINAVIVPGYLAESKLFVTQCPLDETVIDFWTMMFDHGSMIIVLLDPANKGAPLWLEKNEKLQFDDFSIMKENENLEKDLQITLNHTKNKEMISINVFTAEDWIKSNTPPSPEYMLDLLQRVQDCWEMQKCPITVVCSDGCSKSGLFVTLKLVLEKLQIDEEIDIFQVVREIQTRRPEFLVELDQYKYTYKCIRWLLEKDSRDSLYANV
ncbi:receptor-type tyrosine-protein phosphatase mu-like isoform X1 [Mytilus edulis]|uniref:receptor-type tyrosine-protein phosphatase mu-like isoform X1 n=1 Tax=Mytilus edulis TaxID=6550 RepID=UPI0039EFDB94